MNAEVIRRYVSSDHLGEGEFGTGQELHDRKHRGHAKGLEYQLWALAGEGPHRAGRKQQRDNGDAPSGVYADE